MNCKTARGFFSLHLDGGLSFEEQSRLDLHLERCLDCARELTRVRKTVEMLRQLPEVPVSPNFVQDVVRAARQAKGAPQVAPSFWERLRERVASFDWDPSPRLALAGASLLVLGVVVGVGGGLLLFGGHGSPGTNPVVVTHTAEQIPSSGPSFVNMTGTVGTGGQSASGPFEDLIQQMMHRMDTAAANAGDTTTAPPLDWRSARVAGPVGQPVAASPTVQRDGQRGGGVYIDF